MADLPSDVDTEQDRVIFIQSLAQFMVGAECWDTLIVSICDVPSNCCCLLTHRQVRHTSS